MAAIKSVFLAAALGSAVIAATPSAALARHEAVAKVKLAPARQLADLAERYYEAEARFEPVRSTFFGDNRFDDLLPMSTYRCRPPRPRYYGASRRDSRTSSP